MEFFFINTHVTLYFVCIVADWDLYEEEMSFAFKEIYADPTEHPVMVNDEAWSTPAQRRMS